MKKYFWNFFLWWYIFNGKSVFTALVSNWIYTLESINLIPMITSLFLPLYQDYSWEGKLVAVPFRILWVIFGSILVLAYSILLVLAFALYLLIPFVPAVIVVLNYAK